uniref:Reverse transcriptase domain-containing protein n=1 Tax=Tanacetum cinerariifolium TaxID=118510 RepID=A0A6L2J8A3_TANCI|nr:reverse transcriptase domain-containing protein [Tanacetum cinerariifolium]
MKLNPKKCTFRMREGMFLGYKVNADRLKVCSDKVEVVLSLPSLKCLKDVQRLNGKLASLNRFLSKSAKKSLPFFKTLKKKIEELVIYLAATKEAVSAVLMTKRDEKQMPIYFVSRASQGPEINYTPTEKLILALISRLVANQVNETYVAKEPCMITYLEKVKNLASTFKEFAIKKVPKGENKKADALSKMASTSFAHLSKQVLVEELKEKLIDEKEVLAVMEEEGHTWMTPIYEYLVEESLPKEKKKARDVRRKARRYAVTNGVLYKKSFLLPWLHYVILLQANYVLREIHKGSCSMHASPRSVVAKALLGYYWPTMHADARKLIREFNDYQAHRSVPRNPVRNTSFKRVDFVYWSNEASHAEDGGKLGPKWEGPYEVTKALGKGSYKLRDRNGNVLP